MFCDISSIEVHAFNERVTVKISSSRYFTLQNTCLLVEQFCQNKLLVWPDTFAFSEASTTLHNGSWLMIKCNKTPLFSKWVKCASKKCIDSKPKAARGAGADVAVLRPAEFSIQAFIFQISETLCNFWKDTEHQSLITAPFKPKLLPNFGKDV